MAAEIEVVDRTMEGGVREGENGRDRSGIGQWGGGRDGGGGLFIAREDFGRMCNQSFPACPLFLKWRLARAH